MVGYQLKKETFKNNIFPLRITGDNGHEEHHQYLQKYQ